MLHTLRRYWPSGVEPIAALPIPTTEPGRTEQLPPPMVLVPLPPWAADLAPEGRILLPAFTLLPPQRQPSAADWQRTDWLAAAFWYLRGTAERAHERLHGPIDSYAFRLKGWDPRIWQRAWVNRIALFLRRWAARARQADEAQLLGPLPPAELILTHDVDAVTKTAAIRLKQSAFHLFNTARFALAGRPLAAAGRLLRAGRFLLGPGHYWRFDQILELERRHGVRSHFNFYGGPGGRQRTPRETLMDPAYCVEQPDLVRMIGRLRDDGWAIGLHPSFCARDDAQRIGDQRARLERIVGSPVTSCRQHWLRFSWEHTWNAQQAAGLRLDMTLGFNDRPGFRNGAAIRFHPWCHRARSAQQLEAIPLVLADSQLYDYRPENDKAVADRIQPWLDEVREVRGVATLLWHPHTLSDDYAWGDGFRVLLELLRESPA